jgi:hypothetical protein
MPSKFVNRRVEPPCALDGATVDIKFDRFSCLVASCTSFIMVDTTKNVTTLLQHTGNAEYFRFLFGRKNTEGTL